MKKLYTLLLAMALVHTNNGQAYIPFPTQDAVWNVTYGFLYSLDHTQVNDITYFTAGDTVINGNTYTILKKNVHEYVVCIMPWVIGCIDWEIGVTLNVYVGAYRENASHQVLLIEPGDSTDCVLLDYGLATGDTIFKDCPYYYFQQGLSEIGNSDSVLLLDGLYHRRQEITNGSPDGYLIEGVGSTYGFLEPLSYFENYSTLNCMLINGTVVYTATGDTVCQYGFAGIAENQPEYFRIYPVPAKDQLNIKSTGGNKLKQIELIDLTGRIVFKENTHTENVTLNTSLLSKGCYFIRIKDQYDKQITKKIVIQ